MSRRVTVFQIQEEAEVRAPAVYACLLEFCWRWAGGHLAGRESQGEEGQKGLELVPRCLACHLICHKNLPEILSGAGHQPAQQCVCIQMEDTR